nr:hypothetical protein [Tanacetum cinerariifolium]
TTISSGLVQKSSSSTPFVPPLRNDWDLLFQLMFNELLNPPPSVDRQATQVIASINEVIPQVQDDSTCSPSSTTVDQDAPSASKSHTTIEIQSIVIPQEVEEENLDIKVAHIGNDPLHAFADADHAGCQDTRRSTSGSVQLLGERLISWSSKREKSAAISKYQLADLFTKALGRDRIEFLINKLGMRSFTPETLKQLMDEVDE